MVKIDVNDNLEKLKLSFEHLNDDVKRKCKEILTTYGQMARGKAENYTPVLKLSLIHISEPTRPY